VDPHRELTPLETARQRLSEERASGCASPADVAFWKAEVLRLEREAKEQTTTGRRRSVVE
jgi:hypothetical protein